MRGLARRLTSAYDAGGDRATHASVFLAMFLISFSYPVGEAIANEIDTGVLLLLRFSIAALVFVPIVIWREGLAWPGLGAVARYAAIGASLVGFFYCMFTGLETTSALNTGAISTLIPGFTAIGGAILAGERLGWHRLVALLIGLVGALWVVFRGDWERFVGLAFNEGDLIVLAGCVSMGCYSPLVKRFHRGEPVMVMTAWITVSAAVLFLLISNTALVTTDWTGTPAFVYGGIAYIAIGSTVISFFLIQAGTIRIGPTRVQTYSYLLPIFVVLIDWALGKGLPTPMTYPGIAIVLLASLVVQRGVIVEGRSSARRPV